MARRQRALVACVHGLQHVDGLTGADLADDDAVGPHAQGVAHEVADAHLALALGARPGGPRAARRGGPGSRSSAASSMVTTRSASGISAASALSSVVLPAPAPPHTTTFARAATAHAQQRAVPGRGDLVEADGTGPEATDGETRTVDRERPHDRVHPRTIGQAGVDQGARPVDAQPERGHDALDEGEGGALVDHVRVHSRRPCRSTQTSPPPLSMTSSTRGVGQQRLEGAEPVDPGPHPFDHRLDRRTGEQRIAVTGEGPQQCPLGGRRLVGGGPSSSPRWSTSTSRSPASGGMAQCPLERTGHTTAEVPAVGRPEDLGVDRDLRHHRRPEEILHLPAAQAAAPLGEQHHPGRPE